MYEWENFTLDDNSTNREKINLILKNKILKLENNYFNLKYLGINAHFEIVMSADSYIMIFSRIEEDFSPETAVFYINKELDSPRKFINFGLLIRNYDNKFTLKTIRKQEITKHGIIFIYF